MSSVFKVDLSTLTPVTLAKEQIDDACRAMDRHLAKRVPSTRLSEEECMWYADVDQLFGVFARKLRRKPAATRDALLQVLAGINDPKPTATELDGVWDMKLVNCD